MGKSLYLTGLATALLLAGCQAVNTTSGSAVGVERKQYMFSGLSTAQVNQMYAQSYQQTLGEAASKGVLDKSSANARRVNAIASRLIAKAPILRPDSAQWDWEVALIDSAELNASCGPGGKIIIYSGLIEKLKLTDDEIAAVLGHEIAHALREHARERASQQVGAQVVITGAAVLLGGGESTADLGNIFYKTFFGLPNSRMHETEADRIGVEIAARAGYDPRAAVTLWQKMAKVGGSNGPEFLSTHPSAENRTRDLEVYAQRVMPLYQQARR